MSKITFRADDDLIEQLEEFDASKSEIMREALREYLEGASDAGSSRTTSTPTQVSDTDTGSIDDLIAERVDAIVADRLDGAFTPSQPQDINVNIALDGESAPSSQVESDASHTPADDASHDTAGRKTPAKTGENAADERAKQCSKCGESVSADHVYCPNCGEKASHRVFCECGDELRSDWGFCPSCGRRTAAADVLDQS